MLSKPLSPQGMRICSVCDGIDAVMLFASWFSYIQPGAVRTDLSLSEALDYLQQNRGSQFDTVVLVPNASKTALPRLLQALTEEAARHSGEVLILLPQNSRLKIADMKLPGVRVLYGPPFTDAAPHDDDALPDTAAFAASARKKGITSSLWHRLIRRSDPEGAEEAVQSSPPLESASQDLPEGLKSVMVLPVCGGTGATTIAVNLAAELAQARKEQSVCLLDLNLQYGNVATYTGLTPGTRIIDAYRDISSLDSEAFEMCLRSVLPNLHIYTGPGEILPADGINALHLRRILKLAREKADLVVVDLPHQLLDWSGAAFDEASVVLTPALLDVRSAQNLAKLHDLVRSEGLSQGKFRSLINRAPLRKTKLWDEALAQFEKGAAFGLFLTLPEGGDEISMACNAGLTLCQHAPGNRFRIALRDLAAEILAKAGPRELPAPEVR